MAVRGQDARRNSSVTRLVVSVVILLFYSPDVWRIEPPLLHSHLVTRLFSHTGVFGALPLPAPT